MTLQRPVVAQLALQAGLTYKVRLAPAFPPSALTTGLFAVSSVLRAECGGPFAVGWVAPGDGRDASLPPWTRSVRPAGRARRFAVALMRTWSTWGTGGALRCRPGVGLGYRFLGIHAFGGSALLWPERGVIAVMNTLLCSWGIVSVGCVPGGVLIKEWVWISNSTIAKRAAVIR